MRCDWLASLFSRMVSRPIGPPLQKTMMGRPVAKMSNQSVELSAWIGLHEVKEVHREGVEMNGKVLAEVREWMDLWMKSSFSFCQVSSENMVHIRANKA